MKQILAVDDNPTNLTLVREMLKDRYKVTVVTSGEQAIRFLEKRQADLVLLDFCMPGMDGMETLKAMNAMPDPNRKVIFLTALAEKDMVDEGKSMGALGCIAKPFKADEILDAVYQAIGD